MTTTNSFETCLELPWFDPVLNPNIKKCWAAKLSAKKTQRSDNYYLALEAGRPPVQKTYHLKIIFYPPDNKHRDLDNCLSSCKSLLDGIAQAWRVNDKQFRPITIDFGEVEKNGKIEIAIIPECK